MPPTFPKPVQGRVGMLAQIASLVVTGFLIWVSSVRPRLLFQPLSTILSHAFLYAALAWFFAAVITLGLYLFLPGADSARMLRSAFRTAAVAVWFAPACILLSQLSPATLLAALVLVVTATRLLYSEWMASRLPEPEPLYAPRPGMFGMDTPKPPMVTRELCTGLAAAVALQSGIISVWRHQPLFAGAWFVLSAAIVTLFAMVSGAVEDGNPPSLPRSVLGLAATILLATGLTVGGMRAARGRGGEGPDANGEPGRGAVASAREVLRDLFGDDKGAAEKGMPADAKSPPAAPGILPDGSFPGVILWPEVKPITRLVAPPPQGISTGTAPARPYGIPFAGQYLLFRWPQRRPPPTSILQRGSPAALSFSTVDHWPLNMEAIQKLDEPVDLSCCRAIRIEIWNADLYPETVALELYVDDKLLGSAPVRSRPNLKAEPVLAVPETLDFPISGGGQCSELKVTFRRARSRADKSARISIERFVLAP